MTPRLLLVALALGCASRLTAAEPATNRELHALFTVEWEHRLRDNPEFATSLGIRKHNANWTDHSPAAYAARQNHRLDLLKKLVPFDSAKLSAADSEYLAIFRKELEGEVASYRQRTHLMPLNHMEGVQDMTSVLDAIQFESVRDYDDWTARLTKLPTLVDQTIALMSEGMKANRVQTRVSMNRALGIVRRLDLKDPEQSSLFRPFKKFPAGVADADRVRLTKLGRDAITNQVTPSYRKLAEFLEREYVPACYDGVGVWHLADGTDFYRYAIRHHTNIDLTPDQIHDLGLKEVQRIRAAMEAIMAKVGFKGTIEAFLADLRTNPKFIFKNPDDLRALVQAICKKAEDGLPKMFGKLPRTKYIVEPVPEFVAPDAPMAYYMPPSADGRRPGTYYINLYKPESRPTYQLEALCLHEAVPGHHLQIALAYELEGLPDFRRFTSGYNAFVEGWALYCEGLGDELGLYTDPYMKFGRLSEEMLRAVRLVVDTGMHSKKWTRKQAVDYAVANCASSIHEIETEIDRYAAWPGQALAYKIGELKIKGLRAKAAAELGAKFDVRSFHDTVIGSGSIPLDVLETNITSWMKAAK